MWKCTCGHCNSDTVRWCENCDAKNPNEARRAQAIKQAEERKQAEANRLARQEEEARIRKERQEAEAKMRVQRMQEEAERKRQEQENTDAFLKANGHEGFYEYQVLSIGDGNSGSVDIYALAEQLNNLGREGWHLKCAYANELGHNTTPGNAFAAGTNATMDQHILIFERFIKFK